MASELLDKRGRFERLASETQARSRTSDRLSQQRIPAMRALQSTCGSADARDVADNNEKPVSCRVAEKWLTRFAYILY
jgi:hypothetical protein